MSTNSLERPVSNVGMDVEFLDDMLSAMLAHKRCVARLYRSVGERTLNDKLQRHYASLEKETLEHVRVLEQCVTALGGDPSYVSAPARAAEAAANAVLAAAVPAAGSGGDGLAAHPVEPVWQELGMLDAVLLVEAKDRSNWRALAAVVDAFPDDEAGRMLRAASQQVLADEEEHFGWAEQTRNGLLATQLHNGRAGKTASSDDSASDSARAVRAWFSSDA